ncbi:hypothetical protein MferCBS31731_007155 [Microsporum ferrugineum]
MELEHMKRNGTGDERFSKEEFLVNVPNIKEAALAKVACRWRFSEPETEADTQYFRSLNLLMEVVPTSKPCEDDNSGNPIPYATGTALENLVQACCAAEATNQTELAAKVILVPRKGYLCRNDILEVRMRHSAYVCSIIRFPTPNGCFSPVQGQGEGGLLSLLSSAPGALLVKEPLASDHDAFKLLERELRDRLSFDWVLPNKPAARKIALIGGRPDFYIQKGSFGHQGTFEAALALGISVVVVDRPGHWLEGEKYSYLRDDFVAIDATDDANLPSRISEALKGKGIHGIVTLSDEFVIATAKAAEIMGLPTEPVSAIMKAHNKYETPKLFESNTQTLRLNSTKQLDDPDPSMVEALRKMKYPLVVKPCRSGGSRGVKKVNDYSSMRLAIQQLEETGFAKHGVLLETYVDGPEVDANFVLWEGEILFCEISDDFPCQADAEDATLAENFAETVILLPSRLKSKETELIRSSLHQNLLQLGFRSGVFHLEARVQNSSMRYREIDGILELADTEVTTGEVDVFLIEVNARPPGLQSVFATAYTYGVDFGALQLLRALEDGERFKALSKPFSCHAQYCYEIVMIPVHRENIAVPDDFCEMVTERLPEIVPYVARAERITWVKVVSPVGGTGFIAYFLLYSRTDRRQLLRMGSRIQEVSRGVLDGI